MRRKFTAVSEPTEVDNSLYARTARRSCECICRTTIFLFKRVCRSHRMHEIIGRVHPNHAGGKRRRFESITLRDFRCLGDALT